MKPLVVDPFGAHVETLARLNDDGRDGYAAAAHHARDVSLSKRLLACSAERGGFSEVLRLKSGASAVEAQPNGTTAAAFHRGWMGLRNFVGRSDDALVEECLRGETTALASYEHVLARADWTSRPEFRAIVASQLARIRSEVNELESALAMRIGGRDRAAILRRASVLVQSHHTLTLATTGEAGPWASAVSYVSEGFTFYFVSAPQSRHAMNIGADARVAATLNDDFAAWMDIRGLQMEGRAEIVSDLAAREQIFTQVFTRFPFLHGIEGEASDVAAASDYAPFKFTPSRIWFVDHHGGAHARFEIDLLDRRSE